MNIESLNENNINLLSASAQSLTFTDPPDYIKVGFNENWTNCCSTNSYKCPWKATYEIEDYVLRGVRQEWWFYGSSDLNYPHSIRAGTVAYRSYAASHTSEVGVPDSHSGPGYDVCAGPCCQAFASAYDDVTVIKTAGIMLQKSGSSLIFHSEYSAENNCLNSVNCTNNDLSCGNCYVGSPYYGWPCLYDSVGCNKYCSGHGRGMSQWGTYRWAQQGETWSWMVNHYYNANGGVDGTSSGNRTSYMTSPLQIISASPTPNSVAPGQTFTININAQNYAGLAHEQVMIGASLYSSSAGYINDTANDKKVTLNPGSNNVSRFFQVQSTTPPGTYDLIVALWLDIDENNQINTDTDLSMNLKTFYGAVTVTSSQTLIVSLSANPSTGTAPLNGVDLTATVSGSATGTINYTFYCNRSDSGTNITPDWAAKFDNITENPKTAVDVCNYPTTGTYTAKVIAERGSLQAEDRETITVTVPDIRQPISSIDFGSVNVGSSLDKTTTIYNGGNAILTINSITRSSGSTEFTYTNPSTPFNISSGSSQTITVRFLPTSGGARNATFNVNSNDPDEANVTFNVSGTGVTTFDYSLSNSGPITVTQGSSGSNTITATLLSGSTQSVSFSASGLPSGATASFSPGSCSPTCSSTLTISTSASTPTGTHTITVAGTPLSKTTTFSLTVNPPVPNSPSNLRAVSVSTSKVNLYWKDNSTNETSFKIYRKAGTGAWSLLFTTAADAVSYSDTTAIGNTSSTIYSYCIRACNSSGCSPTINVAIVPYSPTGLKASPISSSQINLTWTDNSNNETGFLIYRKDGDCPSKNTWTLVAILGANTKSYSDKGLSSRTTYSYIVRAYRKSWAMPYSYGFSLFSNCDDVITP